MGVFFINWITSLEGPTRNLLLRITIFFIYLTIGAAMFQLLESDNGMKERQDFVKLKNEMKLLYGINESSFNLFVDKLKVALDDGYSDHSDFDRWSFFGSLFFAATVLTTIGYGHLAPRTFGGRSFCMVYAFFGIPITGLMLKSLGERIMDSIDICIVAIDEKVLKRKERYSTALRTSFVLFLIMTLMILLLAGVSMHYEGWSYFEGVYFAFITLSTVGFGDFVPTSPRMSNMQDNHAHVALFIFVTFVYITMGLSVVSSVLVSLSRIFEEKTEWDFIALKEDDDVEEIDHEELLRQQEPPQNFFLH